jgi:glycosyltransferase involved in cell wall biosynthesis
MSYQNVAVLVPCYNEAKTIEGVISDFKRNLPECRVYVYDNNSTDGTKRIAEENGAYVRHERLQGKGNVVRRMFREIDADCYILVDGDMTYSAEDSPQMVRWILEEQADMVIGDRLSSTYFTENKRMFHNFGNKLVRKCVNVLFDADCTDVMTGYRAFSRNFVKTFPVTTSGFEIETEMSIHQADKNMAVKSIPISYKDRPEGSVSKLNTFSDGFKVLKTIAKMTAVYLPLLFWGMIAVFFMMTALVLFVPVFYEYCITGEVPRFPTLIASSFFGILAVQSFFTGVILKTLRHSEKQHFEYMLINMEDRRN